MQPTEIETTFDLVGSVYLIFLIFLNFILIYFGEKNILNHFNTSFLTKIHEEDFVEPTFFIRSIFFDILYDNNLLILFAFC